MLNVMVKLMEATLATSPSEAQIQKAFISYCRFNKKLAKCVFSIPNEGLRTPSYAAKLKSLGLLSGVSDVFVAITTEEYGGLFIEFKRKGAKPTPNQIKFINQMRKNGYRADVMDDLDDAINLLNNYLSGKLSGKQEPLKVRGS